MSLRFLNHNGLVDSPDCLLPDEGCYIALNPKGADAPRAIRTRLDRPSQIMGITEYNRYREPNLENYRAGHNYSGYPDNALITYYVDDSISAPFFGPNFGGEGGGRIFTEDYTDPMGSWKPHYTYEMCCPEKISRLSWINDSTFSREDLMSKQMAIMNQRRAEPLL